MAEYGSWVTLGDESPKSPAPNPLKKWQLDETNSSYEIFPASEARRIAQRLEFHYTPRHGSWLNMAEIEFSVLSRCCLRQRLPDEYVLRREVQALVTERNAAQAIINWRFNTPDARRMPEPNSTASIPSIPNMTDY